MKKIALIVAGGSGMRMKTVVPKQFLLLNGKPLLMHTLEVFYRYDPAIHILLVLPGKEMETWKALCEKYDFNIKHMLKEGGETRFHSVKNNLPFTGDDDLVAVHDGVRPLVSIETIGRCFMGALENGNAIPCIEIPETLRKIDGNRTLSVNRSEYRLIQTPQVFKGRILKQAYEREYDSFFTDDAGVVEAAGHKIYLVEGNSGNIKITFENDLIFATALLNKATDQGL